jgi:hypothetical protein
MELNGGKTPMAHSQNEKCCEFCKIGRVAKRSLRIAFRQDTNLGYVSCLANIPIGVCDRCGCKNWNEDAEAITEDAVRREYVKLLSMHRRAPDPYPDCMKLPSLERRSPPPYPIASLAQILCN